MRRSLKLDFLLLTSYFLLLTSYFNYVGPMIYIMDVFSNYA